MANIPLQSITFPGLSGKYTTPVVDNTLTQAGAAADAKKTGDEISGLKNDLSEINAFSPNGEIIYDLGWTSGAIDGNGNIISSSTMMVSKKMVVSDIVGYIFNVLDTLSYGYVQRVYYKSDETFYNGYLRYTETTTITKDNDNQHYLRLVASKNDIAKIALTYSSEIKNQSINSIKNQKTLSEEVGIYRYLSFERGTINPSGVPEASTYRVRVKNAETITLNVGDIVSLKDYTKYELFWVRYSDGVGVANSGVWLTDVFNVTVGGEYSFAIKSHVLNTTACDPDEVGMLFCVYKNGGMYDRVGDLEIAVFGDMPSYYDTQMATVVSNVYTTLKNAGRDKSAFIFDTDQHVNPVYPPKSPSIIKKFIENVPMLNTVIGGGDLVSGNANKSIAFNSAIEYQKLMSSLNPKFINVYGNHDKNDGVGASAKFTDAEAYLCLQEQMEKNPFIVYGQDYYFYFDSPMEKTRYICANTGEYKMYVEQLAFIRDALIGTLSGWRIVVITHIIANPNPDPNDPNHNAPTTLGTYVPAYAQRLLDLLDAYNAKGSGTIDGADSSVEHVGTPIEYDFTNAGAKVYGVVAGHLHADVTRRSTGNIPILMCDTSGMATYGDYTATQGTVTETAVSIIVFDYVAQKLKMFRIGRGVDITMDLA